MRELERSLISESCDPELLISESNSLLEEFCLQTFWVFFGCGGGWF